MTSPDPRDYQPTLGWWGVTWRVLVTLAIGAGLMLETAPTRSWLLLEVPLGLSAWVLVFFRRRWPVPVAVACTVLSTFSNIAAGPAVWALVSLATRRRWREIIPITALGLAAALVYVETYPGYEPAEPRWIEFVVQILFTLLLLAVGLYVGSRRELIWTLRHRAERAEAEQELRANQAQAAERTRIAREMHDVLAHRISQISMHAGALSFREDLDADALRTGAAEIRARSHEALEDLRRVLGVLRASETTGSGGEDAPQPTYDDLPDLVARANADGASVTIDDQITDPGVPTATGRALYRIVQEGITNARKHAAGATLRITLTGSADHGVTVEMRNRVPPVGTESAPGSGLGLIGLVERAELAGGRLESRRSAGRFVVTGWLPWAT